MSTGLQLPLAAPPAGGAAASGLRLQRWAYAVVDWLGIYLPPLLMALLALLTYWLVRLTPPVLPPEPGRAVRHTADYFMRDFSVKSYDGQGLLKSEVFGTQARHFQDTDVLEIEQPRIRSFDQQGRLITASADRALSNGDGSDVQLIGHAVVVREAWRDSAGQVVPRVEFQGEFLDAQQNLQRLRSHKPVTLVHGADRFSADQLAYDNLDQVAVLTGHVRASVAAHPGSPLR